MKFTNLIDECTINYCDNQSSIHLSRNAVNIVGIYTYIEDITLLKKYMNDEM